MHHYHRRHCRRVKRSKRKYKGENAGALRSTRDDRLRPLVVRDMAVGRQLLQRPDHLLLSHLKDECKQTPTPHPAPTKRRAQHGEYQKLSAIKGGAARGCCDWWEQQPHRLYRMVGFSGRTTARHEKEENESRSGWEQTQA